MILQFLYLLALLPLLAVSLLWWSGLFQQKEYRLDRLISHFSSMGWRGFLISKKIRRPVRTARAVAILLFSGLALIVFSALIMLWAQKSLYLQNARFYIGTLSLAFTVPLIVSFWSSVTSVGVWLVTTWNLGLLRKIVFKYQPTVIGITGSYGKTTTKQLLFHVLSSAGRVFTTPGSVNTPYAIARHFIDNYKGEEIVILEYAAYCEGEIARLTQVIKPDSVILTGLTDQHLALFGTKVKIAQAKAELVESLSDGGIVTLAVPETIEIADNAKNISQVKLRKAWEELENVCSLSPSGRVGIKLNSIEAQTEIIGLQAAPAVSVVILVARDFGITDERIAESLRTFKTTNNWIQRQELLSGATVINDGLSSNPMGFQAAIDLVSHLNPKKAILVTAGIVDLGELSSKIHTDLALEAKQIFDEVWYLGMEGKTEFSSVFGGGLISEQQEIEKKKLSSDTLILVEGKMPIWFEREFLV